MNPALPGLEREAQTMEGLKHYKAQVWRQQSRQVIAAALAERIAGGTIRLDWSEAGLQLDEANPEEDAGPGESLRSRFAALLLLGAQDGNHAVGQFDGQDGQLFAGGSALWKSSLRLDPVGMESMRRRTRKEAQVKYNDLREKLKTHASGNSEWVNYIKKVPKRRRYADRLWTFTLNKLPGSDTLSEVKRFNSAMRFFMKSDYWHDLCAFGPKGQFPQVWGGLKGVEDALSDEGPHVHGHFLMFSKRIDQGQLHTEWTKAVRKATRLGMGLSGRRNRPGWESELTVIAPDLRTVVKRVKPGTDPAGIISRESALDEMCKYMTKPTDLLTPHVNRAGRQVNPPRAGVLVDLCLVKRWPRMFEALGRARKAPGAKPLPSVHTSCISVQAKAVPLPEFWEEGGIEPEERLDFRLKCENASMLGYHLKRERGPTWRELMYSTTLSEWLQVVAQRYHAGRSFRIGWLKQYNPNLDLITLDGEQIKAESWPEME